MRHSISFRTSLRQDLRVKKKKKKKKNVSEIRRSSFHGITSSSLNRSLTSLQDDFKTSREAFLGDATKWNLNFLGIVDLESMHLVRGCTR